MVLGDLIPESFFQSRGDLLLWVLAGGAIALLVYGADRAVGSAAKLAATMGLSQVIIGATVVSLGTTSPEAAVSVNAAFKGNGGLALGNGVGSIICDTALIFGLCCCLTRLPKDRFVLKRHGWLQFGSGALLAALLGLLLAISGDINEVEIPRLAGVVLLGLLVVYLYLSVRWSRQHPEMLRAKAGAQMKKNHRGRAAGNLAVLLVGLGLVVFGSEVLVGSAKTICERHDVPKEIIAVTVIAFGTSLPELVTAITSIIKGHSGLLVGNVIGADILNVLFVIGASATAVPLKVEPRFYYFLVPTMLLVLLLFRCAIFWPGRSFRRWQGAPLLAVYVVFVLLAVRFGVMQ
jgi:cation:H+ antiporter